MAYDPQSKLTTIVDTIRAANDPANADWAKRAAKLGIHAVSSRGAGGRIRWLITSKDSACTLRVEQWPDREQELTSLDPSIGQRTLLHHLRSVGFMVSRPASALPRQRTVAPRRAAVALRA